MGRIARVPPWVAGAFIALALAYSGGIQRAAQGESGGQSGGQSSAPAYVPGEETPEEFPPGRGRDEAFYACVACHNFKLVAAQGLSRERWNETLDFMTARHNMPALKGPDRELILDYLSTTYPERPAERRGWRSPFQR
jgi:mono/diheme cytochrome c family protein